MTKILEDVRVFKACSVPQIRRYLRTLNIAALGCRQKPQHYPEDTSKRILAHLGFPQANGAAVHHEDGKLVSLRRLKQTRELARRGK